MYQKTICFFVFGLLLIPFKGISQKTWTLDNCIAYALEHNLTLENQNYNSKISKEQWQQSKRNMLPTINISYPSYNISYGRTLDQVTNGFVETRFVSGLNGGLSSSVILFESFKKWHQLSYQKLLFESNQFDTQQVQYDLAFRIMELFNNVLFQEGALEIIEEQQNTNLLHQKSIVKKVELGLVAKADFYTIDAATSSDALQVLKIENTLKIAKLALIQEMNLEVIDINIIQDIRSEPRLEKNKSVSIEKVFSTSQNILPTILKKRLDIKMAEKTLAINKTGRLPSIRLSASISTGFSDNFIDKTSGKTIPFYEQIKINQSKFIGLSLNYPIFGNGKIRSSIKIAKIRLDKAQTQLKIVEQNTYKEIQKIAQECEALIAEELLNLKKIKAKEKAYNIAQKKYEKKLINLYELQLANNTYLTAKIEQVRLRAQVAIQNRTLDFYNGTFLLPTTKRSN